MQRRGQTRAQGIVFAQAAPLALQANGQDVHDDDGDDCRQLVVHPACS